MLSVDTLRKVVRCYDPAIDYLRTSWYAYVARRRMEDVTLKSVPVTFHFRLLDDDALRAVARHPDEAYEARAECAFRYGVVMVENLADRPAQAATEDAPLPRGTFEAKEPVVGGAQAPMKPDDAKRFAWFDRVEIGWVVLQQSTLPFDLPYAAPYRLPPTSERILGPILARLAAELRETVTEETSTAKQPASPPEAPSTPPVSVPGTGATAAAGAT